jgi:hypothetical protein
MRLDETRFRAALAAQKLDLAAQHTGVMVALYPRPDQAAELALKGGEAADQLHITLVFLGTTRGVDKDALVQSVTAWAERTPRIKSVISGVGEFTEGPKPVTYLSVDAPRLPEAREDLIRQLESDGLSVKKDHGFTPHMTLDYKRRKVQVPKGADLWFGSVVVAYGDEQTPIPLRGRVNLAVDIPLDETAFNLALERVRE